MIGRQWNQTTPALLVLTLNAESLSAMPLHNHLLRAAHRAVARKKEQALQPAQAIGEALSELNKLPRAAEDQTFDDLLQRLQEAEQRPQKKP
jgi:hypothetical protein